MPCSCSYVAFVSAKSYISSWIARMQLVQVSNICISISGVVLSKDGQRFRSSHTFLMEIKKRQKFPIGVQFYTLHEVIGEGATATVHRALCIPLKEVVAIKILDFETEKRDLSAVSRECQTMIMVDHPNVMKSHCSFVDGHNLWVVMPYMSGGSCLQVLKTMYPNGLDDEVVIATVLREVLKALDYLHDHLGQIHRDVKSGNVMIDSLGAVKLGDYGASACLFDGGDRQRSRSTFVGTPCWMAPEVIKNDPSNGYDYKADIWSFGITALELAHGHAPLWDCTPMKILLSTLESPAPTLNDPTDTKFSKSFKHMINTCLVKDPRHRPSAKVLLKHPFFKQARSSDYISRRLLRRRSPEGVSEEQARSSSVPKKSIHSSHSFGRNLAHAFASVKTVMVKIH